jgi:hypothetical protein
VRQQVSENGPAKQRDNRLFLQVLRGINRLSENVYFSGLTSCDRNLHVSRTYPKNSPQKLIAQGTDWRFFNELKRELKG